MKSTKSEAKARRKANAQWKCLTHHPKYQAAAVRDSSSRTTQLLEEELFDDFFLSLHEHNSVKSYNEQKRILRRIVEKRQAQSTRRRTNRTDDRFVSHLQRHSTSQSMSDLHRYQLCA